MPTRSRDAPSPQDDMDAIRAEAEAFAREVTRDMLAWSRIAWRVGNRAAHMALNVTEKAAQRAEDSFRGGRGGRSS